MTNILLAAPEEVVRRGIRSFVHDVAGANVVAEVSNGEDACRLALELFPHVCILDSTIRNGSCLEVLKILANTRVRIETLVLGSLESESFRRAAVAAGARGYVLRDDTGEQILEAIGCLSRREAFFTRKLSDILLSDHRRQRLLTSREQQSLELLAMGKTNKDIAVLLNLSVRTVETHRANIMRKLSVHSATELLQYVLRNHIVDLDCGMTLGAAHRNSAASGGYRP